MHLAIACIFNEACVLFGVGFTSFGYCLGGTSKNDSLKDFFFLIKTMPVAEKLEGAGLNVEVKSVIATPCSETFLGAESNWE